MKIELNLNFDELYWAYSLIGYAKKSLEFSKEESNQINEILNQLKIQAKEYNITLGERREK